MGRGSDQVLQDLLGLREKLYRLFDEHPSRAAGTRDPGPAHWSPAVDIYDTGETFVLVAEIPGVHQEEINLEISGELLVLRGERALDTAAGGISYHRVERPNGIFQRAFRLPAEVDADQVRATYRDGVLQVSLPKREDARTRPVSVRVEE